MSGYGAGARWNDETQSWEPVADTPGPQPPPFQPQPQPQPLPIRPPVPPQLPPYEPGVGADAGTGLGPGADPGSGSGFGPGPGPGPGPASAPGRSRNAVVAGVVAAVLVAGGVGGWLVWGRDGDGSGKGTAGAPGTTATSPADPGPSSDPSSDSPSPSDSSAPMDDMPPPGFHAVEDPVGFTIAVPENWNRTSSAEGVFYNSPDGKSLVQIFTLGDPATTPYTSLEQTSRNLAAKPGYEQIALERTGEGDTAELVYAYDREEGRRKVVDRAFTGTDGRQYAILVAGPETDWPRQRETLGTALEFFRP